MQITALAATFNVMKWDTVTLNETIPTQLPALALGELTPEEYAAKLSESATMFAELNLGK